MTEVRIGAVNEMLVSGMAGAIASVFSLQESTMFISRLIEYPKSNCLDHLPQCSHAGRHNRHILHLTSPFPFSPSPIKLPTP